MTKMKIIKYPGSCHCGAVRFEFTTPEIKQAVQCNCSICIRKNAVMSQGYIPPLDFTLLTDKAALSVYHWGDNDVNHYFCRHCGIYPFHDTIYEPEKYKVNLGCLDNIDINALAIKSFDGKNQL